MLARRIQEQEEATIRRIVDAMPWPADVKGYDVEFGSDWEGDPVVRVWLLVDDDLRPSDEKKKLRAAAARSGVTMSRYLVAAGLEQARGRP